MKTRTRRTLAYVSVSGFRRERTFEECP
jgi:hypothetical protein